MKKKFTLEVEVTKCKACKRLKSSDWRVGRSIQDVLMQHPQGGLLEYCVECGSKMLERRERGKVKNLLAGPVFLEKVETDGAHVISLTLKANGKKVRITGGSNLIVYPMTGGG